MIAINNSYHDILKSQRYQAFLGANLVSYQQQHNPDKHKAVVIGTGTCLSSVKENDKITNNVCT